MLVPFWLEEMLKKKKKKCRYFLVSWLMTIAVFICANILYHLEIYWDTKIKSIPHAQFIVWAENQKNCIMRGIYLNQALITTELLRICLKQPPMFCTSDNKHKGVLFLTACPEWTRDRFWEPLSRFFALHNWATGSATNTVPGWVTRCESWRK